MSNIVKIFDTTLRDGEQCPGASLNFEEKLQIAAQLERLGVDIIEAGFPVASPDDFRAVNAIAKLVKTSTICGLSRTVEKDVLKTGEALAPAKKSCIHIFSSGSDIHLKEMLKISRQENIERSMKAIRLARTFTRNVEYSPQDVTRADPKYLVKLYTACARAGATTLNIPDTVGYTLPEEFAKLVSYIIKRVPGKGLTFSVHCHDDLGMSVANSLAAVQAGARQIECTINGLGERAGNTALEEVVMAIRTRKDAFKGLRTHIKAKEIAKTSRLVSQLTSFPVPPNKAIVGGNAFAHESGIHQDGIIKKRETYEIMRAEDVGLEKNSLVLGKHSGRNALGTRLKELGYSLGKDELADAFKRFKQLADEKKELFDEDLEVLVNDQLAGKDAAWTVTDVEIAAGTKKKPNATVVLVNAKGKKFKKKSSGTGPVDAAYSAVDAITKTPVKLLEFGMQAVTEGIDAQAIVTVKIDTDGRIYTGKAADTDITVASVKSYLSAVNKVIAGKNK